MAAPARSDVFLLGAGFARAISPAMPLLQDLADRLLQSRRRHQAIPPEVVAMMRENFAHALSYLEQPNPWISEADNLRHRALFLEFSNAIARDLDATVVEVVDQLTKHIPGWLAQLIRHWHEHRCTVLTLNYDTLVESIAALVPLPNGDRIRAESVYPPLLTDAALRPSGARPKQPPPSFRLLKVHGSTNWFYSGRESAHGEPIYFVPPAPTRESDAAERREHTFRMSAVADKYPYLVPPVYDKSALLTHETIRALWFEAGDAVRAAKRIICMGYSLPESDLTMKHFLRTTCRPGSELIIVDPSANVRRNFQQLFRGTKVKITAYSRGTPTLARYVARLSRRERVS
jgi:hypothetical protein